MQYTRLEVGNGGRIKFWLDTWCGDESFKSRYSELFNCALNKEGYIADFNSNSGWNITFRRNLNDWELDSFCQLLQQLNTCSVDQNNADRLIWINSKDKLFSANNCYKMLLQKNSQGISNWHWEVIWKTKAPAPEKATCFGWSS